jgi:hypothetical protein
MAENYMKEKPGSKFIVEKVEQTWPPLPKRKPGDKGITPFTHRYTTAIGISAEITNSVTIV